MSTGRSFEELEQALRDERSEREAAQRRAAALSKKSATWRRRAEERADRIQRLESEREHLLTVAGWLRAKAGRARSTAPSRTRASTTAEAPATMAFEPKARVAYASMLVATVGVKDPVLLALLSQFRVADHGEDPGALERADFVLREVPADAEWPSSDGFDDFSRWNTSPGRQPLVEFHFGNPSSAGSAGGRTLHVRPGWSNTRVGADIWELPTTFDAGTFSPARRDAWSGLRAMADGSSLGEDGAMIRGVRNLRDPWILAAAASGIPFVQSDGEDLDAIEKDAALGRRLAYLHHAPWVVADALLDQVGLKHARAMPRIAAVLVSNRPHLLGTSLVGLGAQAYPRFEVIVGCHGFSSAEIASSIDAIADRCEVTVIDFERSDSLGVCLNQAISQSTSPIIAKIDDDDHYGGGYLVDAQQAMDYAGASLVSKGAVFTYVESRDATFLRRGDLVEQFYRGSPNGASMVFRRDLWDRIGFPDRTLGEDVGFTAAAEALGVLPYATSPWDFVYRRAINGNTWSAVDEVFLDGARLAWSGDRPELSDLTP